MSYFNKMLNTILTNINKILIYVVSCICSYFSPIAPILILMLVFIGVDFVTGNVAYAKRAKKAGKTYQFKSKKAWNTISKIIGVVIGAVLLFFLDNHVLESESMMLTKGMCLLVCLVEFSSWLENMCDISNAKIFRIIKRFVNNKAEDLTGVDIDED